MPELPDLAILADAFQAALVGRRVERAVAPGPLAVRGTPAELEALVGLRLDSVARTGKFLVFAFVPPGPRVRAREPLPVPVPSDVRDERPAGPTGPGSGPPAERSGAPDVVVVNAMLTGRLGLAPPGSKIAARTAVVLGFGIREGGPPVDAAEWTVGAPWLPRDDEHVELRYRDQTQMGKVYLLPAGVRREIPGFAAAERGPDADDPALTLDLFRDRIRRHPGELKNLLRNQTFVAGIGNAYSDEILHEARLLPFRKRASLATEEVDELYLATRRVLARAVDTLRVRVPPTFDKEVRDFLLVHGRGGQPCPRCGARVSEVTAGGFVTSFCRGCQR